MNVTKLIEGGCIAPVVRFLLFWSRWRVRIVNQDPPCLVAFYERQGRPSDYKLSLALELLRVFAARRAEGRLPGCWGARVMLSHV